MADAASGTGESEPDRHPRDRLKRELSLQDSVLLIVASVVGSGIFLTPAAVADRLPQPGLFLAAWLFGGMLSLAGALANAELGAMYPRAGGNYVYLREAFHPLAGFLVGWLSFTVIYTGTVATLAVALGESLKAFFPIGSRGVVAVGIVATILVSMVNYIGVRWGARVNNVTSWIKIVALLVFALAGPIFGEGRLANLDPMAPADGALTWSGFGLALSPILFTYLGWNASVYVASEIRNPGRNVPASLFGGLAICTFLYMVVNAVYLYALPIGVLRAEPNAGLASALALFGPIAGTLISAFVVVSILGTLNATILVGPRIAYAMALDRLFPGGVDRAHHTFHTPHRAVVVQGIISIALILFLQTFERVLDSTIFAIVLATMADVTALYALRRRRPDRARPYRAWGYPWIPALYLLANAGVAAVLLVERPEESGVGLAILAVGLPFYAVLRRRAGRLPEPPC